MDAIYAKVNVTWEDCDGRPADVETVRVAMPLELVANIPDDVFGQTYDETRARVSKKIRSDPRHLMRNAVVEDLPDQDVIGYPLIVPAKRPRETTTS